MTSTNDRRIWIHGKTADGMECIGREVLPVQNILVGRSCDGPEQSSFPNGGLVPALYTAMRGGLDLLLIEETALSRLMPSQISDLERLFADYGVTVKSCSSPGSSNS